MINSLRLDSVDLSFGKNKILSNVNFTCNTGEILAIFGRNGSGKSTLLKIMFGTLKPNKIEFYINNGKIEKISTKNKLIAYLPQASFLPKDITVRRIISMYFSDGETQDKIFYSPLINKIENQRLGTLSLGEQKYLEFLLIINLNHPFILLDEPFAMIEPLYIESIKDILTKYKNDKGIIITDHYYRDVFEIANKKIIIKDGTSYEILNLNELCDYGYIPLKKN
ncbi:MAG TPA: ABC transporter ATP-binding protein [Marinilabiliales bacterium]|jgi:ABC-type multidrug transport system ATPase subunit|nr:MAG: ABC transporter ATP-binding protein [Bacteroidetes bacterium GWA2_40_14]OFX62366.1 MAG: ABC transporter ATP-binding protein [Bacteroidetes bacterium GWC2_40_13]OFX71930.1 MAG: ABC transporter ATP-binding protein [Bacteroidetes bacterium GWD2_40_43]OFX94727.1 MAG: ABC transporter ATP-binding protein [Bacteroidetes bacterium GWE2_40_63]OFY24744.1 MAG: ABC transporter ATP-binding protein [Bacteroidetes bacterium GWF2_40_13]OFZ24490.1 MAG: ABC transporter ATP-binding protein [Bacteroidetes